MKRVILYSLLVVIFSWSCQKEHMGDCFMSTGKMTIENRSIPNFTQIELSDRIQLNYQYSPNYFLSIEGGKNLLNGVSTTVKNGVLEIKDDNRCDWARSFKHELTVTVYAPEFNTFTYRGSGKVNFIDTVKTQEFNVELWNASGDMDLKIKADHIYLKSHTAPGVINAQGECKDLYIFLGGNGKIDARQIEAEIGTAINTNTGKIIINCQNNLKAEIRGSGNIEYFGSPSIELIHSGSGKLIKKN